jgi:hypothetical protein
MDKLVHNVPGIGELIERADLRAADDLLRKELVRKFRAATVEFDRVKQRLIDEHGLTHMERVQTIDTKLSTFIDKIETAADGYTGLFSRSQKVNSDSLRQAYAFDQALFEYHDQFVAGVQELEAAIPEGDVKAVLRDLDNVVTEANAMFANRVEVLRGLATGE